MLYRNDTFGLNVSMENSTFLGNQLTINSLHYLQPSSQKLDLPKNPENAMHSNHLDFQTLFDPKKQPRFFQSRSQRKAYNLRQTEWWLNCAFFSLHNNLDSPNIPRSSFFDDLSWYSLLPSSVTTGVTSSIKIIWKFQIVKALSLNYSNHKIFPSKSW